MKVINNVILIVEFQTQLLIITLMTSVSMFFFVGALVSVVYYKHTAGSTLRRAVARKSITARHLEQRTPLEEEPDFTFASKSLNQLEKKILAKCKVSVNVLPDINEDYYTLYCKLRQSITGRRMTANTLATEQSALTT